MTGHNIQIHAFMFYSINIKDNYDKELFSGLFHSRKPEIKIT